MKLTFLGTRGYIEAKTDRHRMHTALLVGYYRTRVMVDCGEDWRERIFDVRPRAVVVTHPHPDHAFGLKDGAPCPVYASKAAWERMSGFPIDRPRILEPRRPIDIDGIGFEAFSVEHSTRAPAVGYRIRAGRVSVFYVPDVVYIHDRQEALAGIRCYIGDGATLTRSFVRKPGEHLIGHTPVRTQLTWCQKEGVPEAIITHCGSEIVEGDERTLGAELRKMARERGVEASFAHDGLERILR